MSNIVKLHENDPRSGELAKAIQDVVYDRGQGMSIAAIIGCLEIVKMILFESET